MADRRISQLTSADTLVENDLLPFVDIRYTDTKPITAANLQSAKSQHVTTTGSALPNPPHTAQCHVDH